MNGVISMFIGRRRQEIYFKFRALDFCSLNKRERERNKSNHKISLEVWHGVEDFIQLCEMGLDCLFNLRCLLDMSEVYHMARHFIMLQQNEGREIAAHEFCSEREHCPFQGR